MRGADANCIKDRSDVFKTCVHCCDDLGANEVLSTFPVGERLAFDSAKGRLWVICPHCSRWNLTPLEERWEAVEECERRFRGERLRAQTSNIGYVKLREGVGLVRVGAPLRPEFAAWRYGREFSRRRTRNLLWLGAGTIAVAGIITGGLAVGAFLPLPHLGVATYHLIRSRAGAPENFELPRGRYRAWTISGNETMVLPGADGAWHLHVRHHFGHVEYKGAEARRMLASLMVRVNRAGGSDALVQDAVTEVQRLPGDDLVRDIAEQSERFWSVDAERIRAFENRAWGGREKPPINRGGLSHLAPARRLALEMALHEVTEQRVLEGELAELEAAWREAEEIAGIADGLLVPPAAEEFIAEHRSKP